RRRNIPWRLALLVAAMAGLVLINPWGADYPRYLWHALSMPRPQIPEWAPIYRADFGTLGCYFAACIVGSYCLLRAGWRRCDGMLLVLACAVAAAEHLRHVSLFAVVAACYIPAWLGLTPLGRALEQGAVRRPRPIAAFASAVALVCVAGT